MHKQDLLTDFPALNPMRELQQIKGIEEEEEGMDDDQNLPFNKKPSGIGQSQGKGKRKGSAQKEESNGGPVDVGCPDPRKDDIRKMKLRAKKAGKMLESLMRMLQNARGDG